MSRHRAQVVWSRGPSETFTDLRYSRAHQWRFDGGVIVPASSAVESVPLPYSKAENVDPEEAFVASIASCHMLTFLYLAAQAAYTVNAYRDDAEGLMARDHEGRLAVTRVTLRPHIVFAAPTTLTQESVNRLHHQAHERCFIAASVRSEIVVAGSWALF